MEPDPLPESVLALPHAPRAARMPEGLRERVRWLYRQDIPLGCEAGRLAAELIFDMPLFNPDQPPVVPMDRFGGAHGWLATWSTVRAYPHRALELHAAALVPHRGASLDDAFTYLESYRTLAYRILVTPNFPRWGDRVDVWCNWRRRIAEVCDCPSLDQDWPI